MPGIFGTQDGRPQRRRRQWQPGRLPRRELVRPRSKEAARSQPLSACHDRATQAEKSVCPPRCYRVGERKLRVNRLVSLAFSGPTAGAARVVLRTVAVVTAATSQHLPAMEL